MKDVLSPPHPGAISAEQSQEMRLSVAIFKLLLCMWRKETVGIICWLHPLTNLFWNKSREETSWRVLRFPWCSPCQHCPPHCSCVGPVSVFTAWFCGVGSLPPTPTALSLAVLPPGTFLDSTMAWLNTIKPCKPQGIQLENGEHKSGQGTRKLC